MGGSWWPCSLFIVGRRWRMSRSPFYSTHTSIYVAAVRRYMNTLCTLYLAIINNIVPHIKFTIEPEDNGKLPFLDLFVYVMHDGGIKITIYRIATHTDQYLHFTSHHPLVHKRSVVRTLTNKAKLYVTTPDDQQEETTTTNITKSGPSMSPCQKPHTVEKNDKKNTNSRRLMPGLPYVQGTSKILAQILRSVSQKNVSQADQYHEVHACPSQGQYLEEKTMWYHLPYHLQR